MRTYNKKVILASVITLMMSPFAAQAAFVNGGFEAPALTPGVPDWAPINDSSIPGYNVPGWRTTATDHKIELWSDNFQGVKPYEGKQFAELNANQVSTLYQDVTGIAKNSLVGFEFAHRGRLGVDTMALLITDLGANNVLGGGDDTQLFSKQYQDGNTAWGFYTNAGEPAIKALGNTVRFSYVSVSAAGGNPSIGNFIDAANFGVGVGAPVATPIPAAAWLFGSGLLGLMGFRKKVKSTSVVSA